MRILIVNTYYYPDMFGGAEHSVLKLAEGLFKYGNEVYVMVTGVEDKFEIINGVNVYRVKTKQVCLKKDYKNVNALKKLIYRGLEIYNPFNHEIFKRVLNEIKPDVIHTNGLYDISPAIWIISKRNNIPVVHTLRDYYLICVHSNLMPKYLKYSVCKKPRLICKIYKQINKLMTSCIDVVTAPSELTLNKLLNEKYFYESKSYVVPNAIDYSLEEMESKLKKRTAISDADITTFVYLGNLYEHKGISWLLDTFSSIRNPNIRLKILGKGDLVPLVNSYENKDNRIKYLGFCNETEMNKILYDCDVLICPSIWPEPFGRVIIDAYKQCIPVIATNIGAFPEIVIHGQTGLLVEPNNKQKLMDAINYFSESRDNIRKCFKYIENKILKYSLDEQISSFMKIYNNLNNK